MAQRGLKRIINPVLSSSHVSAAATTTTTTSSSALHQPTPSPSSIFLPSSGTFVTYGGNGVISGLNQPVILVHHPQTQSQSQQQSQSSSQPQVIQANSMSLDDVVLNSSARPIPFPGPLIPFREVKREPEKRESEITAATTTTMIPAVTPVESIVMHRQERKIQMLGRFEAEVYEEVCKRFKDELFKSNEGAYLIISILHFAAKLLWKLCSQRSQVAHASVVKKRSWIVVGLFLYNHDVKIAVHRLDDPPPTADPNEKPLPPYQGDSINTCLISSSHSCNTTTTTSSSIDIQLQSTSVTTTPEEQQRERYEMEIVYAKTWETFLDHSNRKVNPLDTFEGQLELALQLEQEALKKQQEQELYLRLQQQQLKMQQQQQQEEEEKEILRKKVQKEQTEEPNQMSGTKSSKKTPNDSQASCCICC